jgi:hypothetical protein
MPQLSLYLDEDTLRIIETEAKKEHLSMSKWVARQIHRSLEEHWPDYYENLFGSITDETFRRPAQPAYDTDSPREKL